MFSSILQFFTLSFVLFTPFAPAQQASFRPSPFHSCSQCYALPKPDGLEGSVHHCVTCHSTSSSALFPHDFTLRVHVCAAGPPAYVVMCFFQCFTPGGMPFNLSIMGDVNFNLLAEVRFFL